MPHRVLLVREWDAQASGSGCCGRLGGIGHELGETETYAHTRCRMEEMGRVYRAIVSEFDEADVTVEVVDPRNMIWLLPSIWRDARRRGMSVTEALRQVFRGTSTAAVVADGKVLFAGEAPDPAEAVEAIRAELARAA
ncbi:MAG TPA: hypothetical protein VML96_11680 [Egibacteraceae bacterium]|nr:hypothetical protein [Egibacteraceae bacterium]